MEENNELDSDVMDPQQFNRFLSNPVEISETNLIPNRTSESFIELGGWKLNVRRTIFESGSIDDVIQGLEETKSCTPDGFVIPHFLF